jgi:hypothetical protein
MSINQSQSQTLTELLTNLVVGDNTVDNQLQKEMNLYYKSLVTHKGKKTLPQVKFEFEKKCELLEWKLKSAFRNAHLKEVNTIQNKTKTQPINEKRYLTSTIAKEWNMSSQNFNRHLRENEDIKIESESNRKRYITETELTKLKKLLGRTI